MSKRTRLLSKLKHVYSHNTKLVLDVSNDDIGLIIEGVEKQIKKKPIVDYVRNSYRKYNCPTCKEEVQINYDITYCLECGQKLDWSEADDSNNI